MKIDVYFLVFLVVNIVTAQQVDFTMLDAYLEGLANQNKVMGSVAVSQ